jgi:uncharacterized glyoxalase superfamily protein PhnB
MTTTTSLKAGVFSAALTVNELEASIRFYTEGLGFTVSDRMEEKGELKGVMLEAGDAKLGLSQDDFAKGRGRVKGVGMRLYIETKQDIEALARQAKDSGVRLENGPGPLPWGPMGFTLTDPDGFKLTIANPE